jgi:signal transduction histidine kinase
VKVVDNGIGFDASNLRRKSGIQNIQERASENGFHADVISAEGVGTTVLISFGVQLS